VALTLKATTIVADCRSENNENRGSPADRLQTFRLVCISALLAPVRQFATKKVRAIFKFFFSPISFWPIETCNLPGVLIQAEWREPPGVWPPITG
jgi:hypothetical protein